MFATLLARLAMLASLSYYAITICFVWIISFLEPEFLMEVFLETTAPPPGYAPLVMVLGIAFAGLALVSLGWAYWSIEHMIRGGEQQDFLVLSARLKNTAIGLIGFWIGYNLLTGLVPALLALQLEASADFLYDWDPLDTDIVLLILGIALFAVSRSLHRAWEVEEENKQFL